MFEGAAAVRPRSPRARSHITNDPRRLGPDIDKRTHAGRLFGDLYDSVAAEFPGADGEKIRKIALLRFELEKARTLGTLTLEDTVRLSYLIEISERQLRKALQEQQVALRQQQWEQRDGLRSKLGSLYDQVSAI
jgi:hypothetical protein